MLKYTADAPQQALSFLISQASHIEQQVWETRYPDITYQDFVPIDNSAPEWVKTVTYFSTDGGRILGLYHNENECVSLREWMHPRVYTRAPWAQVRFQDVRCVGVGPVLSGDPLETSFYPLSSFGGDLAP